MKYFRILTFIFLLMLKLYFITSRPIQKCISCFKSIGLEKVIEWYTIFAWRQNFEKFWKIWWKSLKIDENWYRRHYPYNFLRRIRISHCWNMIFIEIYENLMNSVQNWHFCMTHMMLNFQSVLIKTWSTLKFCGPPGIMFSHTASGL